jgi:hypothetical protein
MLGTQTQHEALIVVYHEAVCCQVWAITVRTLFSESLRIAVW